MLNKTNLNSIIFFQKDLKIKNLTSTMPIEKTIFDFQLSIMFGKYKSHMNAKEQQTIFKDMGVKTLCNDKSLDDTKRTTVIFEGLVNLL